MKKKLWLLALLLAGLPQAAPAQPDIYRTWIAEMRDAPRGPFSRIRWFCNDGTVLPPKAYACRPHGGGVQHGEWSERALELRARGYRIANLLAGIDAEAALAAADFEDDYGQRLVEKFLMGVDNGWIFERALFYRGAIQEEDERSGAHSLLTAMLAREDWIGPRFLATRTGARLLPHGADSGSIARVREQSAALSQDDAEFMPIRIKIHGTPDAGDAAAVRAYIDRVNDPALRDRYRQLAEEIDRIYRADPMSDWLGGLADRSWLPAPLRARIRTTAGRWDSAAPLERMALSGALLAGLRDAIPQIAPGRRLDAVDAGLRVEAEHYRAATEMRAALTTLPRADILVALSAAGDAAYGAGLLNARLHDAQSAAIAGLQGEPVTVADYRAAIAYLGRVPGWGLQAMRRFFYQPMLKLAEIEPLALLFIQDQLRASPLLFYSEALGVLGRDAGRLAGVRHLVFGEERGSGLNPLNPGLARGRLYTGTLPEELESLRNDGIYLLPETVSDLPPVAGILTAGAGNPLSHVQLLARNLGIPNVSVDGEVQAQLRDYDGKPAVLAVSPGGLVEIAADGERWNAVFGERGAAPQARIEPDLDKLDLSLDRPLSTRELSAEDSGRTVGPKAAKLAELRRHYPEAVGRGVAIPFGVFRREVLDRPHRSGATLFQWMQS
jgi:hypothetical protein